jgi:hypothetical protein
VLCPTFGIPAYWLGTLPLVNPTAAIHACPLVDIGIAELPLQDCDGRSL